MARSTLPAARPDVAEAAITGGVDTHLDVNVVAALDRIGGLLGTASFPTTPLGYAQLLDWLLNFGPVVQVGVEGTSSYGAGLTRALQAEGVHVVEVDRPNRQKRRRVGGSAGPTPWIRSPRPAPHWPARPSGCPRARTGTSKASGF